MAYDKGLAQRVREMLEEETGYEEKKMFGGLCFMFFGHMVCGIIREDLIVRVGPNSYEETLKLPHTKKFDLTGKPLKGWVMVLAEAIDDDDDLNRWLQRAVSFVRNLPPKNHWI
jgi:TfoX/Sxy family transcriptional regulator of competence genes